MNEYITIYKNIGLKVYDFLYYYKNKDINKYFFKKNKEELKDELKEELKKELNIIKNEDEFIIKDKKKKKDLNELKKLVAKNLYLDKTKLALNKLYLCNLDKSTFDEIKFFNKNISNKYEYELIRTHDVTENIKLKIYFDCIELNKKVLLEFIKEFNYEFIFENCFYSNKNMFNIMFENNKSIKIDYEKKYIEFDMIINCIYDISLSMVNKKIKINFRKFKNYKKFSLKIIKSYLNDDNRNAINKFNEHSKYVTLIENYNNLEKFKFSADYSFGFIIYSNNNDNDYFIDLKNITFFDIEVNFDIFYIGEIPFYIIYFDNTIKDINDFINKIYNINEKNTYIATSINYIKYMKFNFYNYNKNYLDKICFSNITVNKQIYSFGIMTNAFVH